MIKRLRRKFIVITMCSILAVLGGIIGGINFANYISINRRADEKLALITENRGRFPHPEEEPEKKPLPAGMSPETPLKPDILRLSLMRKMRPCRQTLDELPLFPDRQRRSMQKYSMRRGNWRASRDSTNTGQSL